MNLWKKLFGESQKEAWTRLAAEIGGALQGNFSYDVSARLGGHDITLDTFTASAGKTSTTYTRMRAPFANSTGLRFGVHRASVFTGLAKALGKQDIEIGVPGFDDDFVIQGNDEERVREVLADPVLRALVAAQPRIALSIKDDGGLAKVGPTVDVLAFYEVGVIKDVPRLAGMFSLFAALLSALQRGGHPLDVPEAEFPAAFTTLLEEVTESLGAQCERVGDALEARVEDPLAITTGAKLRVTLPRMPALTTSLSLEGRLPISDATFVAKPRGLLGFGGLKTGDEKVDDQLRIEGDAQLNLSRLLRPLARLAPHGPTITVTVGELVVQTGEIPAHAAFSAVGSTLDLWQELIRLRAGFGS